MADTQELDKDFDGFSNEEYRKIALFAGSDSDLSKLDFTVLNLKFIRLNSPEFSKFFSETNHFKFGDHNLKFFESYLQHKKNCYLLVPIELDEDIGDFWLVRTVLSILFPSDISLVAIIKFQFFDKKYLFRLGSVEHPFQPHGVYGSHFLNYEEKLLPEINQFINVFIDRYDKLTYLKRTIASSYISSFRERYVRMQYLSLCISLESIVNGKHELLYRISRYIAIICGNTKNECWVIFKNIEKIYNLRSKIVHGEEYKDDEVKRFMPYLKGIVSRMIIELIVLNLPDKKTLNDLLTEIGFGEKDKISKDYKVYDVCPETQDIIKQPINDIRLNK